MSSGRSEDLTGLSPDALAELERLLASEGVAGVADHAIPRRDSGTHAPMSFSQELIWLLDRATPGMTAYNLPIVRRLRGSLDRAALARALSALVARHEALRTRFAEGDGHPVQLIDPPADIAVNHVDLSSLPAGEREREAERLVSARAYTPIDLAHEHSFRVSLIRLADDDHVLVLETHHIVADGWSLGIMFRELAELYAAERRGAAATLPPLPIQFGDYAAWQRKELAGERLSELMTFWRSQLGNAVNEPLALPTDFPRPATPTFAGSRENISIRGPQLAALRKLGQAHDATLYMTLLAAYATVLHRYTGRTDVLIGSGSAARTQPETHGIIGYVNNTLVQRGDFSGDPSFAELLGRVRRSAIAAYDHQDMPLEKLVLEMREGQQRLSHAPLFEVVLTMQDTIGGGVELADLAVSSFGFDFGATKFDITLLVFEREGEVQIAAQYRTDLFAPESMRRFLGHVVQVIESAAANPSARVSQLQMLTPREREERATWQGAVTDEGAASTIDALFEEQARRVPDRIAVHGTSVTGRVEHSYADVDARANQIANYLHANGVTPGAPVGLLLDRSADAIVALLGILKGGGAYVPLSLDAPEARLAQQIAEAGIGVVLTLSNHAGSVRGAKAVSLDADAAVIAAQATNAPTRRAAPDSLAYVLYTSGSTGTPKGVAVTHANAVHYARAVSRVLGGVPPTQSGHGLHALDGWSFALASTLAADLGNTCLLPSLVCGGTLHVLTKDTTTEPGRFAEYMAAHPVDVLKLTPNHLRALIGDRRERDLASVLPRKWIVTGGEAMSPDLARTLLAASQARVLNHYGPTETTVGVCTFEVTAPSVEAALKQGAQTMPLGRPLSNTRAYVVDRHGNDMPAGVPGELAIGGAGVTAGYLNRPDLTAERFADLRADRVYRTGDLVRWLPDGTIEFLGRADDQVKVRGYRVELAEIEQALRQHPSVAQAAVLLRRDREAEPRLVAYAVPKAADYAVAHAERPSNDSLRQWLESRLPDYMIPEAVVLIETLPLTPNGKIDRAKLPAPEDQGTQASYVAPRSEMEEKLVAIWADVLKRDRIGVTDRFLDLGGHSLMAIRVLGKISKTFGVRLPLRTLFDAPTIEQLAFAVQAEGGNAPSPSKITARPRRPDGTGGHASDGKQ